MSTWKDTTPLPSILVNAPGHTTCARCQRAVLETDVDADRLCVLCRPAPETPEGSK